VKTVFIPFIILIPPTKLNIEICLNSGEIPTVTYLSEINEYSGAIVRCPGKDLTAGLTTTNLGQPDYFLALKQHEEYVKTLKTLELKVTELDALPGFPDAHFVEDVAVLTPEVAIITRPGAPSRRDEIISMAPTLENMFSTASIKAPGILDGGDVLILAKNVYVGISDRTNVEGAKQLETILSAFGYATHQIPLPGGLHLKSSVNYVGENLLLLLEEFVDIPALDLYEKIIVAPEEAYACNTLWINDNLILPDHFPETRLQLEDIGLPMYILDMSEMEKLDGGLTCLSLRY